MEAARQQQQAARASRFPSRAFDLERVLERHLERHEPCSLRANWKRSNRKRTLTPFSLSLALSLSRRLPWWSFFERRRTRLRGIYAFLLGRPHQPAGKFLKIDSSAGQEVAVCMCIECTQGEGTREGTAECLFAVHRRHAIPLNKPARRVVYLNCDNSSLQGRGSLPFCSLFTPSGDFCVRRERSAFNSEIVPRWDAC